MTTITIDTWVQLPKTHFRDLQELTKVLLQYQFETDLLTDYKEAKKIPKSDWKSI